MGLLWGFGTFDTLRRRIGSGFVFSQRPCKTTTNQISIKRSHQGHTKLFSLCHTLASHLALCLTCVFSPVSYLFLFRLFKVLPVCHSSSSSRLPSLFLSSHVPLCLSCSATAISSDGWDESELVRVKILQTIGGGTGIFNTYRLYSMSAIFPR